jgi:anti-sigma regulatory factor (Ser/Thr protein kinase)
MADDAYFELSFSPNAALVPTVRRFVSEFYAQVLADEDATSRLALATHELLENAVRYSSDGNTSVRIAVKRLATDVRVVIDTRNRAADTHITTVRERLDALSSAADPQAHYQMLMRQTAKRKDGSGLGLGRVRAETDMTITYQIDADYVLLRAEANFARSS